MSWEFQMGMAVFSFEKNNFFLKISSFLKIGVHDTFPLQRSILDHGLSLLPSSFRKAVYTQFLFTYLEHGQRGGGKSLVSRGKIETREHLRLIAPLPNQSSIFPARFPALYPRFFRSTKSVSFSFSFFSFLLLQISVVPLLHFKPDALASSR